MPLLAMAKGAGLATVDKSNLAKEVYQVFYDNTESFDLPLQDDNYPVGTNLAYILGAIVSDDRNPGFNIWDAHIGTAAFLMKHFEEDHQIWDHITFDEKLEVDWTMKEVRSF